MVKVPIKLSDDSVQEELLPLHLPYDIVRYLFCDIHLSIRPEVLDNYWNHLDSVGDDWAASTRSFRAAAGRVVPLGFYGDEAVIGLINAPTNKIHGLTLNIPVWRPCSTRLSRFLLWSIESDKIVSVEKTIFPVLQLITDSFNELAEQGVNGIRFLVSEIRGDQVFFRQIFQHRSWWKTTDVCFRCRANVKPGRLNYCNYFDDDDGWTATARSTDEFIVHELPNEKCILAVEA